MENFKSPTSRQIHIWDNDGGNHKHSDEAFAIINGTVCYTVPQKMKAYLIKYWRHFISQLIGRQPAAE